ncbi:MAG: bifunctional methylenetetrahydrofolate dehydrogenase/methenyltetrahydrofolate cyclohydrolase FolD [Myxococcota bacterium]|nr:bifunctional methylenetetrahydrofolate dehydrogenase/methenyltetrahydrofolate cyclohydrolase FolD [Myxococcota bacterium]
MSHPPIETVVVDGLALAKGIRSDLAQRIATHNEAGHRAPCLAVVLVGDDPASASYIKGKQRACGRIGMESVEHRLPASTSEKELLDLVENLNGDPAIDGILVQLPLPKAVRANAVTEALAPEKDVDGLSPVNQGRLLLGEPGHRACTPLGVMKILEQHDIPLESARAVVIGRSALVGKPVSLLLQHAHATVTMCHSRTADLPGTCREADVLVAAVGVPRLVQGDWVKPGAAVIDVGVSEVDGKLVGDVDTEGVQGTARIVTPHRRGVGPMTVTMLLSNTLDAFEARLGG